MNSLPLDFYLPFSLRNSDNFCFDEVFVLENKPIVKEHRRVVLRCSERETLLWVNYKVNIELGRTKFLIFRVEEKFNLIDWQA